VICTRNSPPRQARRITLIQWVGFFAKQNDRRTNERINRLVLNSFIDKKTMPSECVPENNSPTCLSRGLEVSYKRDEDFPEPPASGNPNPECTKPRTRVTNINEYYFCNVRAVRHQFYLIYCLFTSYANVNSYVSLFLTVSVHCSLGCHTAERT
jgi:hypothetical protein